MSQHIRPLPITTRLLPEQVQRVRAELLGVSVQKALPSDQEPASPDGVQLALLSQTMRADAPPGELDLLVGAAVSPELHLHCHLHVTAEVASEADSLLVASPETMSLIWRAIAPWIERTALAAAALHQSCCHADLSRADRAPLRPPPSPRPPATALFEDHQ